MHVLNAAYFTGAKRFSLQGCDSLLPMINKLVHLSSTYDLDNIIIGMPHRGRLNLLANLTQKPLEFIFSEFAKTLKIDDGYEKALKGFEFYLNPINTTNIKTQNFNFKSINKGFKDEGEVIGVVRVCL